MLVAGDGPLLLVGACAAEDATHHVMIPLVAGELDHSIVGGLQLDQRRPRLRPRRRIADRQLVIQRSWACPREALDEVQTIRRSHEEAL